MDTIPERLPQAEDQPRAMQPNSSGEVQSPQNQTPRQLRLLDGNLIVRPFLAEIGNTHIGRCLVWGCDQRPSILYLQVGSEPTIEEVLNPKGKPGAKYAHIDCANVQLRERNRVILAACAQGTPQDMLLGVKLSLPHGMKGERPIEVYRDRILDTQDVHCDHSRSTKLRDGRSLLTIWALVRVDDGTSLRLLHVRPHTVDLLEVSITSQKGHLRIKTRVKTPNAALYPSAPNGAVVGTIPQ